MAVNFVNEHNKKYDPKINSYGDGGDWTIGYGHKIQSQTELDNYFKNGIDKDVSRYVYTYDERGLITGETAVESLAEYENIVGEALAKCGYGLYYYKREDSTLEEDFFVRTQRNLLPVEVKAKSGTAK